MPTLLTCVVITVSGTALGGVAVLGMHRLISVRAQRASRDADDLHCVTACPDGSTATVLDLDVYRRRRRRHVNSGTSWFGSDDGPA